MFKQFPPAVGTLVYYWHWDYITSTEWKEDCTRYITSDNCFESPEEARLARPAKYYEGVIYANQSIYVKECQPSDGIYATSHSLVDAKKTFVGKGWAEMSDYHRILEIDLKQGIVAIYTATYDRERKPMYQWTRTPYTHN